MQTNWGFWRGVLIKWTFWKPACPFSRLKKRKWSFSDCNERFKGWATLLVSLDLSGWTFCRENELSSSPGSWDTKIFESQALGQILAKFRRLRKMRRSNWGSNFPDARENAAIKRRFRVKISKVMLIRHWVISRNRRSHEKLKRCRNSKELLLPLLPLLLVAETRWDERSLDPDRLGMITLTNLASRFPGSPTRTAGRGLSSRALWRDLRRLFKLKPGTTWKTNRDGREGQTTYPWSFSARLGLLKNWNCSTIDGNDQGFPSWTFWRKLDYCSSSESGDMKIWNWDLELNRGSKFGERGAGTERR